MIMKYRQGAALAVLCAIPMAGFGQDVESADEREPEEIVVIGRSVSTSSSRIEVQKEMLVDTATALRDIPGANVNANGLITGIAQYRGMFGDRVSVDIDQLGVISGGPNAMDTPLSYMSPMITEELVVERGIAGVSKAPESIGGHIATRMARGDFGVSGFDASGVLGTRFSGNGDLSTTAGRLTLANRSHRLSAVTEFDSGNDIATPAGVIRPSGLHRKRYDLSYGLHTDQTDLLFFVGRLDTKDAGTPALPMDIRLIDSDLYGLQVDREIGESSSLEARIAYNRVEHLMDNFTLRGAPMPMMYRQNLTHGSGAQFSVAGTMQVGSGELRLGIDGIGADHDSVISNPNMAMFRIDNFVDVERDVAGVFAEWTRDFAASDIQLGLRYKQVNTNAGPVAAMGMPEPMATNVGELADAFNAANRDLDWNSVDVVFKYRGSLSDATEWIIEAGSKTRAPSYQELYLWLPLQAAGGLADGRTYIGNLNLDDERSNEIVLGLTGAAGRFSLSPQVYYRNVDNYIQGTPSNNMLANMVSMMMSGSPALQFSNVDAEIWGLDVAWKIDLADRWFLDGIASLSRGRRTDVSDNLYRLAPANGSIGLTYSAANWLIKPEVVVYAGQDKVSSYNDEQSTPGYGLINIGFDWRPTERVRLEARVDNLLDRQYQDHLTGINRAMGSDIPVGTRLYGAERTLSAGVMLNF